MRDLHATILMAGLALLTLGGASVAVAQGHGDPNPHGGIAALNCRECHACERPTKASPCLNSCPRHHNNFQGEHQKDEGPEVVIIDQLAELYEPVVFSHGLHAGMSEMLGGCTNCHHYSEESGTIPACRECHDPDAKQVDLRRPSLKGAYHRQCINCHVDWSHANACVFCHAEVEPGKTPSRPDPTDVLSVPHPMIEATPFYTYQTDYAQGPVVTFHHEDHVAKFGLQCVDCHRGQSCSRCHDSLKNGGKPQRAALDHVTSCIVCHGERDCAFCHSQKSEPAFHHAESANFSLTPYHEKVACNTCHGEPKAFRQPDAKCTSCHIHWEQGSFDHRVTGVALDETHGEIDCVDCHVAANFARSPACDNCHDEPMFPSRLPGQRIKRAAAH